MNLPHLTCTHVPTRPDGLMGNMTHWRCRLTYEGRSMTLYYSMGSGHGSNEPGAMEVLGSLFMDASSASESFEDFCANCGYDTDSRTAEKIYKACTSISIRLRKLLGGAFDKLQELATEMGY